MLNVNEIVIVKKFIIIISALFFAICLYGISEASERLDVTASFYPLAHLAEEVGGNKVDVIRITPGNIDPHEYEPTARDMIKIQNSNILILNGAGLEPWAKKIKDDLKKKGVRLLVMSESLDLQRAGDAGRYDPHIWLDPLIAKEMVEIIGTAFISADPQNQEYYLSKGKDYINKLLQLHEKYKEGLASCKRREMIVSHDAFGYMARRYDLEVYPISGLSPEEEPSPKKMAEIVKIIREKQIKYIFTEALVNPKTAETIAHEAGAEILTLNPVSGLTDDDIRAGRTYISVMEDNLSNLRLALSCK